MSSANDNIIKSVKHVNTGNIGETAGTSLANCLNEGFLTTMKDFQLLTEQPTLEHVQFPESSLVVTSAEVFKALSAIKPTKAQGPDGMLDGYSRKTQICLWTQFVIS